MHRARVLARAPAVARHERDSQTAEELAMPDGNDSRVIDEDVKVLHHMGYAQELARRMGGFSNFAISFSIICILAGGITAFPVAFSAGGAVLGRGRLADRRPVRAGRRPLDGADRLGLPDGRRALSLGLDPGRPRLWLGLRLDQPAGPDLRRRLGQCRRLPAVQGPGPGRRVRHGRLGLGLPGAGDRGLPDRRQPGPVQPLRHHAPRRRSPTSPAT